MFNRLVAAQSEWPELADCRSSRAAAS